MSPFNIITATAADCGLSLSEVSQRIENAKRQKGSHVRIRGRAAPAYWVPLSKADQLLDELFLQYT